MRWETKQIEPWVASLQCIWDTICLRVVRHKQRNVHLGKKFKGAFSSDLPQYTRGTFLLHYRCDTILVLLSYIITVVIYGITVEYLLHFVYYQLWHPFPSSYPRPGRAGGEEPFCNPRCMLATGIICLILGLVAVAIAVVFGVTGVPGG